MRTVKGGKGTAQTGPGPIKAFLGDGTEFEGLLSFEGTIRIDGMFNGEIRTTDCLIIGETATIKAEIKVGHLVVMGNLNGNVVATHKVEITSTGRVNGDLVSPRLMIQEGALLEGNISMMGGSKKMGDKVVDISDIRSEAAGKQTG